MSELVFAGMSVLLFLQFISKSSTMKFLKVIGVIVLVILVIGVIVNFISPVKMEVSESIIIKRSAATIFLEVNDLKNRKQWSPWELADTTMVISYGEITEGVGATTSWISNESGTGKQEIIESTVSSHIKTELIFDDRPGVNYSVWTFEELGDSTNVTWTFDGAESPFLFRFFNLVFQGMVEESYRTGLKNLKELAESRSRIMIKNITAEVFASELSQIQHIITMIDTVDPDGISEFHATAYAAIGAFMAENGLENEAAPVGIYHFYSDTLVILEVGIPISEAVEIPEGMNMLEIPPTKVASATHVGSWDDIGKTHDAIDAWLEENGIEMNGYPWHVYFNTLEQVGGDPAKLYTQVHYPIK